MEQKLLDDYEKHAQELWQDAMNQKFNRKMQEGPSSPSSLSGCIFAVLGVCACLVLSMWIRSILSPVAPTPTDQPSTYTPNSRPTPTLGNILAVTPVSTTTTDVQSTEVSDWSRLCTDYGGTYSVKIGGYMYVGSSSGTVILANQPDNDPLNIQNYYRLDIKEGDGPNQVKSFAMWYSPSNLKIMTDDGVMISVGERVTIEGNVVQSGSEMQKCYLKVIKIDTMNPRETKQQGIPTSSLIVGICGLGFFVLVLLGFAGSRRYR